MGLVIPWPTTKVLVVRVLATLTTIGSFLFLVSHLMACLWAKFNGLDSPDHVTDYVRSVYFVFATASTVGYGDEGIDHESLDSVIPRYLFAIFIIVFGLTFFAYTQGMINSFFVSWNRFDELQMAEIVDLDNWFALRNMTKGVSISWSYEKSVKEYYETLSKTDVFKALNMNGFIDQLDFNSYQTVYSSATISLVQRFVFFEHMPDSLVSELFSKVQARVLRKNEVVLRHLKPSDGIYFIYQGTISIASTIRRFTFGTMVTNEYFGDFCLMNRRAPLDYVVSETCLCLFIDKEDAQRILRRYPDHYYYLSMKADERVNYLKKQRQVFLKSHGGIKFHNVEDPDVEYQNVEEAFQQVGGLIKNFLDVIPGEEKIIDPENVKTDIKPSKDTESRLPNPLNPVSSQEGSQKSNQGSMNISERRGSDLEMLKNHKHRPVSPMKDLINRFNEVALSEPDMFSDTSEEDDCDYQVGQTHSGRIPSRKQQMGLRSLLEEPPNQLR